MSADVAAAVAADGLDDFPAPPSPLPLQPATPIASEPATTPLIAATASCEKSRRLIVTRTIFLSPRDLCLTA
jgi:hypothetical protein